MFLKNREVYYSKGQWPIPMIFFSLPSQVFTAVADRSICSPGILLCRYFAFNETIIASFT